MRVKNPNRDAHKKQKKKSCAMCKYYKMGWGRNEKANKPPPEFKVEACPC